MRPCHVKATWICSFCISFSNRHVLIQLRTSSSKSVMSLRAASEVLVDGAFCFSFTAMISTGEPTEVARYNPEMSSLNRNLLGQYHCFPCHQSGCIVSVAIRVEEDDVFGLTCESFTRTADVSWLIVSSLKSQYLAGHDCLSRHHHQVHGSVVL